MTPTLKNPYLFVQHVQWVQFGAGVAVKNNKLNPIKEHHP